MESEQSFEKKVEAVLALIGDEKLFYHQDEERHYKKLYDFINHYAVSRQFLNTAVALPVVRAFHDGMYRGQREDENGTVYKMPYVIHCLTVCRMLIDLHIELDPEEEDVLLASALCHDMIGKGLEKAREQELMTVYHLDQRVYEAVKLVTGRDFTAEDEHKGFFDRILSADNKLALLVKLTDCSCIVEQLYNVSFHTAKEYIYQTRMVYMPMCVIMRERYPELFSAAGILMEKMRSLSEVTKILISRYEDREIELNQELLELQDEKIRMKRAIQAASKQ